MTALKVKNRPTKLTGSKDRVTLTQSQAISTHQKHALYAYNVSIHTPTP